MQTLIIVGIGILIVGIVLFNLEKIKKAVNGKDLIKKSLYLAVLFGAIELLHYLLKEIIYLEAIVILSTFIVGYLIIISLFIAKKRSNFFIRHYILTFFLGIVVYNYVTYPSYTYRYKMTVEVETPEGLKSGSSVIEVHTEQWNSWMTMLSNGYNGDSIAYGGAIWIDLEKGESLLVLLEKGQDVDHANYMLPCAVPMKEWNVDRSRPDEDEKACYGIRNRKARQYYGTLKNAKGILPEKKLPTMLSIIQSSNDETIVDEVTPSNIVNAFGEGVKFKNITIETTDDIVGNMKNIPMWSQIERYMTYYRYKPYKKETFIKGIFKPQNNKL
ncbi:MAG: hypothetical protein KGQ36_00250 [Rickettsiales bacterium]|nr:hypothetical protein [Rickettsiales bacterium]